MRVETLEKPSARNISIHPMDMRSDGMVCLRNDDTEMCVGFLHGQSGQFERFIIVTHVGEDFEGSKPWQGSLHYTEDAARQHLEEILGRPLDETAFLTSGEGSDITIPDEHLYSISDIMADFIGEPFSNN